MKSANACWLATNSKSPKMEYMKPEKIHRPVNCSIPNVEYDHYHRIGVIGTIANRLKMHFMKLTSKHNIIQLQTAAQNHLITNALL